MDNVTEFIKRKSDHIEWMLRLLAAGGWLVAVAYIAQFKAEMKADIAAAYVSKGDLQKYDEYLQIQRSRDHSQMIGERDKQFADVKLSLSLMQQTLARVEKKIDLP